MSDDWYGLAAPGEPLTQGDLVFDCPIIGWEPTGVDLHGGTEPDVLVGASQVTRADVVVMTQACDLAQRKIANVVLCPHLALPDYENGWKEVMRSREQDVTAKAWKRHREDICRGFVWNLSILNRGGPEDLTTGHRIVDFRYIYTVPRVFLESLLSQRGRPRLRLRPPYREHLSQAFARFFMRVGLPTPVGEAW